MMPAVGTKIKFRFRSRMMAAEMAVPQVINATGSVSQRCCDSTHVAFTLVSKYTIWLKKCFHRLYGSDHEVLHFRKTRLSLGTNNENTRLKTQVLCQFSCCTTYLLFLCSTHGFYFACSTMRRDSILSTITTRSRRISKKLKAAVSLLHAHSTCVITALPVGLGYEM